MNRMFPIAATALAMTFAATTANAGVLPAPKLTDAWADSHAVTGQTALVKTFDVLANDTIAGVAQSDLNVQIEYGPHFGKAKVQADNTIIYSTNGIKTHDTIVYSISAPGSKKTLATVNLFVPGEPVMGVGAGTYAKDDHFSLGGNKTLIADVRANDSIVELGREDVQVRILDQPKHGEVRVLHDEKVIYVATETNTDGTPKDDSFTYTISWRGDYVSKATVNVSGK